MLFSEKPEFTFSVQLGRYIASFVVGEFSSIRLWSEVDTAPEVRTLAAWWTLGGRFDATSGKLRLDHHEQVKMINAAYQLAVPTILNEEQFWIEWTIIIACPARTNGWVDAQILYDFMLKLVRIDLDGEHDEFAPSALETFRAGMVSGRRRQI